MRQVPVRGSYVTSAREVVLPTDGRAIGFCRFISLSDARLWMVAAFVAAFIAAAGAILTVGPSERGIDDALLLTARVSFVLFWPAYAGGAAARLFGSPFDVLKRQGRNFGLAFASAHVVHLCLVAWLCYIGAAPPIASFVVFGIAVVWTYLLAIASVRDLHQAIGQRCWRFLSVIGMNYIAFAFALDFMRLPFDAGLKYVVGYLPFVVLALSGIALRVGASVARLVRGYARPPAVPGIIHPD
jgi:hypothetical protein